MTFIIIIGIVILLWLSVIARIIAFHPVKTICYAVRDTIMYFRHKQYNYYNAGILNCYCAHFGGGKTLSIVHYVDAIFKRYNNKRYILLAMWICWLYRSNRCNHFRKLSVVLTGISLLMMNRIHELL